MRTTTTKPSGLVESRVRCQVACPVREAAPGKRAGRKTGTAPRADFTTKCRPSRLWDLRFDGRISRSTATQWPISRNPRLIGQTSVALGKDSDGARVCSCLPVGAAPGHQRFHELGPT